MAAEREDRPWCCRPCGGVRELIVDDPDEDGGRWCEWYCEKCGTGEGWYEEPGDSRRAA